MAGTELNKSTVWTNGAKMPGYSLPLTVKCEHLLDGGVEQISALASIQVNKALRKGASGIGGSIWRWGLDSSVHFSADHFYL